MKNRAFKMYLLSLSPLETAQHLFQCLNARQGEMAWELFEKALGEDWNLTSQADFLKSVDLIRAFIKAESESQNENN